MRLPIDEDEDKPSSLTLNFFTILMNAETKRKGIFQLLSFTRKRDRVYSTKLNDGFFILKAMMVNEAAEQIEKDMIKPFSILEGWIRNHGECVVVVKEAVRFWDYTATVGSPKSWKIKKDNINTKGSHLIVWDIHNSYFSQFKSGAKQQKNEAIEESVPFPSKNTSKVSYSHLMSSQKEEKSLRLSYEQTHKEQEQPAEQTVSILQHGATLTNQNLSTESIIDSTSKQKEAHLEAANKFAQNKKRIEQIMHLLLSGQTSDEEETTKKDQPEIVQKQAVDIKVPSGRKSEAEKKIDLKFIFDCLDDEQNEESLENTTLQSKSEKIALILQETQQPIEITEDEDEDSDSMTNFTMWLCNKNRYVSKQPLQGDPPIQSAEKTSPQQAQVQSVKAVSQRKEKVFTKSQQKRNKMQKYLDLQTQFEVCPEVPQTNECTIFPLNQMLHLQDIYHGIFRNKQTPWWVRLRVVCIGSINQTQNYMQIVVSDEEQNYLLMCKLTNVSELQIKLNEGLCYRFTKGTVRTTSSHYHNGCNNQLEFDCQECIIKEDEESNQHFQDISVVCSSNYCSIKKICSLEENLIVNTYGILKSVKVFKGKTSGSMTVQYEIVDPILKWSINLVHFTTQVPDQSYKQALETGITVYGVEIGSFKGKKNLVTKPFTVIRLEWLPSTKQGRQLRLWLQNGSKLADVEVQLTGFTELTSLKDIEDEHEKNLFIKNVTILSFVSQYTYRACVTCLKKVENGRCRSCGPREEQNVFNRYFLRGSIADGSAYINMIWSETLAEKILLEGFMKMEADWLLKTVDVWIEKGNSNSLTLVKMRKTNTSDRIANLLSTVRKSLL